MSESAAPLINSPELVELGVDKYKASYEDTATWLAEVLDGQMRTEFSFDFDGNELIAADGRKLAEIFDKAIEEATNATNKQPQMAFEVRRRLTERAEYDDMIAMMRGELPNTMVVISDFPAELMDATQDIGGYNVRRRQTMMRVITRQEDDSLLIQSQSLDGSFRHALEGIYESLGHQPQWGELLGQRTHIDLPEAWQAQLRDNLTAVYDQILEEQNGGKWFAGRCPEDYLNTYDFVLAQHNLLETFTTALVADSAQAERLRYGLAAAIEARYCRRWPAEPPAINSGAILPTSQPYIEMQLAATIARQEGRSFSGCGLTLDMNSELSAEQRLTETGYGNKTNEETKYAFDKEMHCVVCQSPPKKDEAMKKCGPCGICKSCDVRLKSKIKAV